LSEQQQESVLSALTLEVRMKIMNQKLFLDHINSALDPDEAADAAMRAFTEHLQDPRTVERACEKYFINTGSDWGQINELTKDMWRKNVQAILSSALE
jgi:hypothetical protein